MRGYGLVQAGLRFQRWRHNVDTMLVSKVLASKVLALKGVVKFTPKCALAPHQSKIESLLYFMLRCLALVLCLNVSLVKAALPDLLPPPPSITATSYVLYEPVSDTFLLDYRADVRLPPASLTKIMTSYVIASELQRGTISLEDMVPISVKAWRQEGSRMFVREGTRVSVDDLINGIIVQSGNDASVAMAEFIAGSEEAFADLMNEYGRALGLKDSSFSNATGLPMADHYTTARDLAILTKAMIRDFPEHYARYQTKEFTYNDITQKNRNLLLWRDKTVDGVKTGHTEDAGYCLVSSAVRNDMRLISVVMGTDSMQARATQSQKLLKYGFRAYEVVQPYRRNAKVHEQQIWMGAQEVLPMGLTEDLILVVPRGKADELSASVNIDRVIKAPVERGQVMGTFELSIDKDIVAKRQLVALQTVETGGIFLRLWHWIYLKFVDMMS